MFCGTKFKHAGKEDGENESQFLKTLFNTYFVKKGGKVLRKAHNKTGDSIDDLDIKEDLLQLADILKNCVVNDWTNMEWRKELLGRIKKELEYLLLNNNALGTAEFTTRAEMELVLNCKKLSKAKSLCEKAETDLEKRIIWLERVTTEGKGGPVKDLDKITLLKNMCEKIRTIKELNYSNSSTKKALSNFCGLRIDKRLEDILRGEIKTKVGEKERFDLSKELDDKLKQYKK